MFPLLWFISVENTHEYIRDETSNCKGNKNRKQKFNATGDKQTTIMDHCICQENIQTLKDIDIGTRHQALSHGINFSEK